MKSSAFLMVPAALVLLGTRIAAAQPGPPSFEQIDADKSGSLSKDEVVKFFEQRRAAAGGGGGGGGGGFDPAQVFERWDANHDGSVSKAEFDARPRRGGGGGPPPQN